MPTTKKRIVKKRLHKKINSILSKSHKKHYPSHCNICGARIRSKVNFNIGGVKMINVVEKKIPVTYSTSHTLDREVNERNIQSLLKRHSKLLKRLAE